VLFSEAKNEKMTKQITTEVDEIDFFLNQRVILALVSWSTFLKLYRSECRDSVYSNPCRSGSVTVVKQVP
jgi:hypothetical protein